MEKSTDRELWVKYKHPQNKTVCVRWFESDSEHTAEQKAQAFINNRHQSVDGKIMQGAKTAEEALKG